MTAKIIDGKQIALNWEDIAKRVSNLQETRMSLWFSGNFSQSRSC